MNNIQNVAIQYVSIDTIDPPLIQLRRFDPVVLEEMARSVDELDFLQPILVRPSQNGRYQLVFGGYRLKVARMRARNMIPAVIRCLTDEECVITAIAENVQRSTDMDPKIEGECFDKLCKKAWTQVEIARKLGKNVSYVIQRLDIYRQLHPTLLSQLSEKHLSLEMAHAICKYPLKSQITVAQRLRGYKEKRLPPDVSPSSCRHCPIHCPPPKTKK